MFILFIQYYSQLQLKYIVIILNYLLNYFVCSNDPTSEYSRTTIIQGNDGEGVNSFQKPWIIKFFTYSIILDIYERKIVM